MKLEDELKEFRYIRERIDLTVNDDGFVILPAWQFALFVREYNSYRSSSIMWLVMFVLVALVFIFFLPALR